MQKPKVWKNYANLQINMSKMKNFEITLPFFSMYRV